MAKFDNRIMTVEELYQFCLKNNFAKFDSLENGKELLVFMNGNFEKSNDEKNRLAEGMTHFVSKAFHDHINLNNSQIKPKDFKENVPSSHLRPILANIKKDEETGELDFGSHDFHIETETKLDEDGNEVEVKKVIYDEQPIGVIDGSQTSIEYDKEAKVNRAIFHGYLFDEYCQDAIDILNRRGTVDCSIELAIRKMSFDAKTKTLVLEDFYVSGLTLLSANTKPGMAGSNFKIEDFSINTEAIEFNKNDKLIELLESLNEKLSNFNKSGQTFVQENQKEGGKDENMKFEELLAKYNKTAEDITFDYSEMSEEELIAKFEELFGEDDTNIDGDNSDEPSNDKGDGEDSDNNDDSDNDHGEDNQNFEKLIRTYEISYEDVRWALYNLLAPFEDADNTYYYIVNTYDDYFVYESYDGSKTYGQKYITDGDNVSFDGERYELFAEYLTASEKAELESIRSNYAALVEYKANAEKNELHAQREAILSDEKYSVLSDNEAFVELQKNMDNYSLEDLEKEAKVIFADHVASVGTFALNDEKKQTSKKLFGNPNTKKSKASRYGDLFRK